MGNEVVVLTHCTSEQPYFPLTCNVFWIDGRGRQAEWTGPSHDRSFTTKFHVMSELFNLSKALTQHFSEFDVVLANHSLTAFPVRWCRTRGGRFYYVQAYEPEFYAVNPGWSSPILARLSSLSYRLKLHQIVNSPIYCGYKEIQARHVVPPGIDTGLFHPATNQSRDSDRFVIGCIGRAEAWKGTSVVADAYRLLSAADSRYVLRVAYGNLPGYCRNLRNVEVVVPPDDAALADYYRSVDVLVAPGSLQLGAPHYPVMEAMACGVPVVTTGYFPATSENAWIVPVNDPRSIADAVCEIREHSALAKQRSSLGLEAIQSVSWPSVAASMLSIFQEATKAA